MPKFDIGITRRCLVKNEAKTIEEVARLGSSFLDTSDDLWKSEHEEGHLKILEIRMVDRNTFLAG